MAHTYYLCPYIVIINYHSVTSDTVGKIVAIWSTSHKQRYRLFVENNTLHIDGHHCIPIVEERTLKNYVKLYLKIFKKSLASVGN